MKARRGEEKHESSPLPHPCPAPPPDNNGVPPRLCARPPSHPPYAAVCLGKSTLDGENVGLRGSAAGPTTLRTHTRTHTHVHTPQQQEQPPGTELRLSGCHWSADRRFSPSSPLLVGGGLCLQTPVKLRPPIRHQYASIRAVTWTLGSSSSMLAVLLNQKNYGSGCDQRPAGAASSPVQADSAAGEGWCAAFNAGRPPPPGGAAIKTAGSHWFFRNVGQRGL